MTAKPLRLVAVFLLVLVGQTFKASSQTYTNLHLFSGFPHDGATPVAGLVQGNDGNFYGTTEYGGGAGTYWATVRRSGSVRAAVWRFSTRSAAIHKQG